MLWLELNRKCVLLTLSANGSISNFKLLEKCFERVGKFHPRLSIHAEFLQFGGDVFQNIKLASSERRH